MYGHFLLQKCRKYCILICGWSGAYVTFHHHHSVRSEKIPYWQPKPFQDPDLLHRSIHRWKRRTSFVFTAMSLTYISSIVECASTKWWKTLTSVKGTTGLQKGRRLTEALMTQKRCTWSNTTSAELLELLEFNLDVLTCFFLVSHYPSNVITKNMWHWNIRFTFWHLHALRGLNILVSVLFRFIEVNVGSL